jgi:hypothetical protein
VTDHIDRLLGIIQVHPTNADTIKALIDEGCKLGRLHGGPSDGQYVWTRPGPPESLYAGTYVLNGIVPGAQVESWRIGFHLHRYEWSPSAQLQTTWEESR